MSTMSQQKTGPVPPLMTMTQSFKSKCLNWTISFKETQQTFAASPPTLREWNLLTSKRLWRSSGGLHLTSLRRMKDN